MNINDRRVRKTKKALREALASLLMEKELHSITIKELTDTADVHRSTFYSHYQDVYDLYEKIEDSVVAELDAIFAINPTHTYEDIYQNIIDYVHENPILCRMFLSKNRNRKFQNRICELIERNYLNIWLFEESRTEITEEMCYISAYHVQGCIAIISLWLESNFSCPKEKVIELFRQIDINIEKITL